jgi:predicted metal-dependent peptidase
MTNEDKAQAKQRARVDLQRAIDTQKQIERSIKNSPHVPERDKKQQLAEMGKTLSNFEDIIKEFTQTQTPWREILQQFISSFSYNDYSYSQPNRYNVSEFYMPGLYQGEPGNITLALDVSGSTATIAHRIANEIFSALTVLHEGEDPQLNIIYCSNYIHEDVIISHPDEIKTIIGGGTSFNPVMKRMQDKTSQGLIMSATKFKEWEKHYIAYSPNKRIFYASRIFSPANFRDKLFLEWKIKKNGRELDLG